MVLVLSGKRRGRERNPRRLSQPDRGGGTESEGDISLVERKNREGCKWRAGVLFGRKGRETALSLPKDRIVLYVGIGLVRAGSRRQGGFHQCLVWDRKETRVSRP